MKQKLKITIITCTYNRIEKLKKNIQSVKEQNFENYEHIILDDGSNDETQNYLSKINDKKIKYFRFDTNYGQPTLLFNSNIFSKILGDYVVFLDSDDYLFQGAFDTFSKVYSIYGEKIWNYAFDFSDEKEIFSINNTYLGNTKMIKISSQDCFKDNHPRNLEKKGYRDFLNFRNKSFYKEINKYFTSPDLWYSALYEVGLNINFDELYIYKKIYFMNFDKDSVTRGFNIDKYKKHTLISKENIFSKYRHKMDSLFFIYNLKSLILNYLVNENYKKKILKLVSQNMSCLKKDKVFLISIFFMFFFPSKILIFLKTKIKFFKNKRY